MISPTAMILVGGLGSRLRAVLGDVPKALAPIEGRAFLDHQLSHLSDQGVTEVILATGHGADSIRQHCEERPWPGLRIHFSQELEALGTAGAIRNARHLIGSGPVLVLNGDSLLRVPIRDLQEFHSNHRAEATIALTEVPDRTRFGSVELDSGNRVARFLEKGEDGPGWISAGLYLLGTGVLDSIPAGRISIEEEVFPNWIGWGLFGFRSTAAYVDIGTPDAYALAQVTA